MTDVTRSLAEIRATCTKAARGAGCPWGMAEEAGQAAFLLSAHGLAGANAVATLLRTPRNCACDGRGNATCGLRAMVALMDEPPQTDQDVKQVAAPLLLVAATLGDGGADWRVDGDTAADIADVRIALGGGDKPAPSWASRSVSQSDWAALEAWAARTYVPETEASRASGAGPADSEQD